MTEFNNNKTSLDDVHVGDHVAFMSSMDNYWRVATVTAETKTTLSIGNEKFVRRTGNAHGQSTDWHKDKIEALGKVSYHYSDKKPTYADEIRNDAERRADEIRRRAALTTIDAVRWRKLSTEVLEAVAAIVEAEKVKEETK